MRNVLMIRRESGLVSIPVESAVYCGNCETVSTSSGGAVDSADLKRSFDWFPRFHGRGIRARLQPRSGRITTESDSRRYACLRGVILTIARNRLSESALLCLRESRVQLTQPGLASQAQTT